MNTEENSAAPAAEQPEASQATAATEPESPAAAPAPSTQEQPDAAPVAEKPAEPLRFPATQEHADFLSARGYENSTIDSAAVFISGMSDKTRESFLADFGKWQRENAAPAAAEFCGTPVVTNGVAGNCGQKPGHEGDCKAA